MRKDSRHIIKKSTFLHEVVKTLENSLARGSSDGHQLGVALKEDWTNSWHPGAPCQDGYALPQRLEAMGLLDACCSSRHLRGHCENRTQPSAKGTIAIKSHFVIETTCETSITTSTPSKAHTDLAREQKTCGSVEAIDRDATIESHVVSILSILLI